MNSFPASRTQYPIQCAAGPRCSRGSSAESRLFLPRSQGIHAVITAPSHHSNTSSSEKHCICQLSNLLSVHPEVHCRRSRPEYWCADDCRAWRHWICSRDYGYAAPDGRVGSGRFGSGRVWSGLVGSERAGSGRFGSSRDGHSAGWGDGDGRGRRVGAGYTPHAQSPNEPSLGVGRGRGGGGGGVGWRLIGVHSTGTNRTDRTAWWAERVAWDGRLWTRSATAGHGETTLQRQFGDSTAKVRRQYDSGTTIGRDHESEGSVRYW